MVETGTARLTKRDLVEYLASGCKPQSQFRCDLRPAEQRHPDPSFVPKLLLGCNSAWR